MMNMKKTLALLLAAVMVLGMFPFGAMAEETVTCTCTPADDGTHAETCALYVKPEAPVCTCTPAEDGTHAEGCALYVKPEEPVCTCTPVDGIHAEECALYKAPVVPEEEVFNVEEAYAYVMSLENNEAVQEYLNTLDQEDLEALIAYAQKMDPPAIPETKVFTQAGPFMPAVNVAPVRRKLFAGRNTTSGESENGLILDKDVVSVNDDGTYTLRLEAYVTGKTVTSTVTTAQPADIVLVLDQSGSMAYDFNGKDTSSNPARRQYAMKQAVVNFIGSVQDKYSDACDNRMAIVTFGSNASVLQGWTFVNESGETALKNTVNVLPNTPSGATNVAAGMKEAETLMGDGYNYSGSNTTRQKVVIVFTDGVPTTSTEFSTSVATNAIKSAKNLKDAGITVYSVGIFNGAEPSQLHGAAFDYQFVTDVTCTGEVGSIWGAGWVTGIFGGNDFPEIDIAAGNRFLNYLSTNFEDSTEIGIEFGTYDPGKTYVGSGSGYKITKNFDRDNTGYYLTAADASSLDNIFQQISSNIQTGSASMTLGAETVVQDIVSDYFTIPSGASSVTVYTSDYQSNKTWGIANPASYQAVVNGKNVTVSGFDFTTNYVDLEAKNGRQENDPNSPGEFYGRKLILEIIVEPEENFLGGNVVPTNGSASGVYNNGKLVEAFDVPTTDVPVETVTPVVQNQNVYLLGSADLMQLLKETDSRLAGMNNDYVTAWYEIYDGDRLIATYAIYSDDSTAWIPEDNTNLPPEMLEDKTYTVTCTLLPNNNGTYENTVSEGIPASVNVFKPTVTWKDSEVSYNQKPVYESQNLDSIVWMHGETLDTEVNMLDGATAPGLTYTYDPKATELKAESHVKITKVQIGETDVTQYVTHEHKDCKITGCKWDAADHTDGCNFIVHLATFDLTITKAGVKEEDSNAAFIFNVLGNGVNMDVVIYGNNSVTIKNLPAGNYTVKETSGYWRYTLDTTAQTASATNPSVIFTNALKTNQWLDDIASVTNKFTGNKSDSITR